jgi:hypothetical protein
MSWFSRPPDPDEIRRQAAISFLRSLEARLSGDFSAYVSAIESGQSPESVFSEFGIALADLLRQQQTRIADSQNSLRFSEIRIEGLLQENERLRNEPVRQKLGQAQQQIHDLTARAEKSEHSLAATRRALEAEQTARQREMREMQRAFVTQNSIIAKQRIQLDNLGCSMLPGEPSDAETSEDQS